MSLYGHKDKSNKAVEFEMNIFKLFACIYIKYITVFFYKE